MNNVFEKRIKIPEWEMDFRADRASGPGGQNVNKTATKVTLKFDIGSSKTLHEEEKKIVLKELRNHINKDGKIVISEQSSRSQFSNRQAVIKKLNDMINDSLKPKQERVETKIPQWQKDERLTGKKKRSEIKKGRGRIDLD